MKLAKAIDEAWRIYDSQATRREKVAQFSKLPRPLAAVFITRMLQEDDQNEIWRSLEFHNFIAKGDSGILEDI